MNRKQSLILFFIISAFLAGCSPVDGEKITFLTENRYAENTGNLDVFFSRYNWSEDFKYPNAEGQGNSKNTYRHYDKHSHWLLPLEKERQHIATISAHYRWRLLRSFRQSEYPEVEQYIVLQARKIGGDMVRLWCTSSSGMMSYGPPRCEGEIYRKP